MNRRKFGSRAKALLCLALALTLCAGLASCAPRSSKDNYVKAALLYNGGMGAQGYLDTWSQLEQSFAANMEAELVDVSAGAPELSGYDLIFLDAAAAPDENLVAGLVSFVEAGGCLVVPNALTGSFDPDFLGVKEAVKLEGAPEELTFPETGGDLSGLQGLVKDFASFYDSYSDYDDLSQRDYGCGFVPGTAESLAEAGGLSLYGVNSYGKGKVLYTNPLLPNSFSINGFSIQKTDDSQKSFANSTATANQLFLSEVAAYVSKLKYGYSVSRVLGSFTSPSMAWQLHYEEITGIANGSARIFGDMCMENGQIPSFTLIRNSYEWFNKFETVTYLLSDNGYKMDYGQNAYSSGVHVVENGAFLSLAKAEDTGSYFVDNPNFMQMAYPHICDLNGDGMADIVCGSSDGQFYYFEGESIEDGQWTVKARQSMYDSDGGVLSVGAYSSPSLSDFDQDGYLDMISGCEGGEIYYYQGGAGFAPGRLMLTVPGAERAMPVAADLNGDTLTDLAVGGTNGRIALYYNGGGGIFEPGPVIECPGETFVAPWVYDYDGDGDVDLVYGTFKGYIARLRCDGDGQYVPDGIFDISDMNFEGNNHIKFGANCVPRFYDLNGDRQADLIAGSLEYGLAVPIDSPYFPYRQQLQEQIDYMKKNNFYLGLHFYTNQYASPQREAEELKLHKAALDSYGVDSKNVGANMHTWFMSSFAPDQTINSAHDAGLLWLSGGQSANSAAVPQASAESILSCPFFKDFKNRQMMVTNASVLGYDAYGDFAGLSARYDLPVSEYYHCDFVYEDDADASRMIKLLGRYKKEHNYNFVREDQFMKSAAAAYNMELVSKNEGGVLRLSAKAKDAGFPLYDRNFQSCVGVRIDLAEATDPEDVTVDADVWRYDSEKKAVYVALDRRVSIRLDPSAPLTNGGSLTGEADGRILSVNVPATVAPNGSGAKVKFKEGGMMQLTVAGRISRASAGWDTDYSDGVTTFTRFGEKADLEFSCK